MTRLSRTLLAAAVPLILLTAACDSDSDDEQVSAVCVDPNTGNRVDDDRCGSGDSGLNGFEWFYIATILNQPPIGTQVVHNTYYSSVSTNRYAGYTRPPSATVYRGVPKTGWTPSKSSTSFVPKDTSKVSLPKTRSNVTVPKVQPPLNQRQAPPKPVYNPPPRVRTR